MDAKITKKRLVQMLSYDWLKIIGIILIVCILWSLLFATTATRITPAQQFTILNYTGSSVSTDFNNLPSLKNNRSVFSYDILEVTATDVTTSSGYDETLMQTRFTTNEGDAVFVAGIKDTSTTYKDKDGVEYNPTYLEKFLINYNYYAATFGDTEKDYIPRMKTYLNEFFYGDCMNESNTLDKSAVENTFRARIKKLNDKRFKSEKSIQKGILDEEERILLLRSTLKEFLSYIDRGYISYNPVSFTLSNGETSIVREGIFSINLCPNEETMGNLKNCVYYYTDVPYLDLNGDPELDNDGNEKTHQEATAKDMNIILLDNSGEKYNYSLYESLSFVNYLVRTYCSELQ